MNNVTIKTDNTQALYNALAVIERQKRELREYEMLVDTIIATKNAEIERLRLIEAAARDMLCERDRAVEGGYHSELAGTAHKLRMALEKGKA